MGSTRACTCICFPSTRMPKARTPGSVPQPACNQRYGGLDVGVSEWAGGSSASDAGRRSVAWLQRRSRTGGPVGHTQQMVATRRINPPTHLLLHHAVDPASLLIRPLWVVGVGKERQVKCCGQHWARGSRGTRRQPILLSAQLPQPARRARAPPSCSSVDAVQQALAVSGRLQVPAARGWEPSHFPGGACPGIPYTRGVSAPLTVCRYTLRVSPQALCHGAPTHLRSRLDHLCCLRLRQLGAALQEWRWAGRWRGGPDMWQH